MRKIKLVSIIGVLIAGALFYYIWSASAVLAEMHRDVKKTEMVASSIGFGLDEKEEITIHVKSSIYEGDALITLQNENNEVLYTFDTDCSQKETFSIEAGSYKLRVDSDQVRGKFDIVVRR
ncbi:hypothetical protein HNQ56_004377 [Anaerotaenia torta]|uniref:hypothetical protein n=1 Tax=Anaerotaenia torta TaxID=433293 RepID=UPI003D1E60E7